MKKIKYELKFDGLFVVSNEGRGSGLAMMWRSDISIWVDSFSKYHIDARQGSTVSPKLAEEVKVEVC